MTARKKPVVPASPARVESLQVKNYRALCELHLDHLTPLTVLLGPNGSGKSTIFDVFNFLSECFTIGLRKAWDKRGRFRELRSRGSEGPISFELRYLESPALPPATYHLVIDERDGNPVVKGRVVELAPCKERRWQAVSNLEFQERQRLGHLR